MVSCFHGEDEKEIEWVVKIGGSLFPHHAILLAEKLVGRNVMVVCGGGSFANLLRQFDQKINFSPTTSHKTAILSMDMVGLLLADKVKGAEAVKSIKKVKKTLNECRLPVLIPSTIIESRDPLEHSWRVTSDSISIYLSHLLEAKLLIATDVDGIYTDRPSVEGAKFIKELSAKKLLNFGETSLDESFAELLIQYKSSSYVVNGQYPERVIDILEDRSTISTFIGGD